MMQNKQQETAAQLQRGDGVSLQRDVRATVIPQGQSILLPEGALVRVIQALGGTHTIEYNNQWLMVHAEDSDALGLAAFMLQPLPEDESMDTHIWTVLKTCYDPEIPVNIVDLGLIYEVGITPYEELCSIQVVMTLTAAGCGMGPVIVREVERKLGYIQGVHSVYVTVVFDPPWTQMRMTDEAKLVLNLL